MEKLIPLLEDSKLPIPGMSWRRRISADPRVHERWLREGYNIGMPTVENNRSVVDFDVREEGERFLRERPELCQVVMQTLRGFHIHFAGVSPTYKFQYGDVKSFGSYVVYQGSKIKGHVYTLIKNGTPPEFPAELFPRLHQQREITRGKIRKLTEYLAKVESTAGKEGSRGLVRAISCCKDAGLSESQTTIEILKWNNGPTVRPPWSHDEIARAITRAYRKEAI